MVLAGGSPEAAQSVNALAAELVYAMGRDFDFERVALPKSDAIVLSLSAVAPMRGAIPNGTSHKRSQKEFWSSYSIDFVPYATGDANAKLAALSDALLGAVNQVPDNRMPSEIKIRFAAALETGIALLQSDIERLRPFQRPLV